MMVFRRPPSNFDFVQDTTGALADTLSPATSQGPDSLNQGITSVITDAATALGIELGELMQKAGQVLVILLLAWLGTRLLRSLTARWSAKYDTPLGADGSDADQRSRTLIQLLNSIGFILIAAGAGLSILNLFVNIGPLLAGVGVLGLAVSFGAQNLVKDVISGFFILFENQYDLGDVVEINGIAGAVEKMTLRVVTLRDLNGVVHIIPNGAIQVVSNKTSGWSRTVLDVGVAYKERVDEVLDVLRTLVDDFAQEDAWKPRLAEAPEILGVNDLGDSSVVIRLLAQTKPGKQWEVKRELLRRIKNRFDELGIEIPFPQRTVHMRSEATGA